MALPNCVICGEFHKRTISRVIAKVKTQTRLGAEPWAQKAQGQRVAWQDGVARVVGGRQSKVN